MGTKNHIGLIDVDGHNFPNLALMKLSAYHKQIGDRVEFINHFFEYDTVYKSKVFTFSEDSTTMIHSAEVIMGGIGYGIYDCLDENIEHTMPDYDLYKYPHALGFLTRGCIRKCSFCVVPKKEGGIKRHADINEFLGDNKTAVLMDNNVLSSDWGLSQIEKMVDLKLKVDFNQGLDARIIADNPEIASVLGRLKWLKPLRMACDSLAQMDSVVKSIELLRKYGAKPKRYFIYVLVTDIDDAHKRVKILDELKVDPFAQPLITDSVKPTKLQKDFARWVNHKAVFRTVPWEKYK